jgi:hypothetical protein
MTLEGQEIHEKHQKSECCLKATAGVSRRALIQATGAIDASVPAVRMFISRWRRSVTSRRFLPVGHHTEPVINEITSDRLTLSCTNTRPAARPTS